MELLKNELQMMTENIKTLFATRTEQPLYYIESGSRLWGIESPDSDYDVRGFHLLSKIDYFDFKKHRDVIEVMEGDFDFVSYDLDKMFGLLAKSNPTVFEWIRADTIYWNVLPDWEEMQQQIVRYFDFGALYHHYLSMTKHNIQLITSGRKFTYKTVFYCIRALLSADLARQQLIPALLIHELFAQFEQENEIIKIAKASLEKKKSQTEKEEVAAQSQPNILAAIQKYTNDLADRAPEKSNYQSELRAVLRAYSFELKSSYYT